MTRTSHLALIALAERAMSAGADVSWTDRATRAA
jgi:hypothetical protein